MKYLYLYNIPYRKLIQYLTIFVFLILCLMCLWIFIFIDSTNNKKTYDHAHNNIMLNAEILLLNKKDMYYKVRSEHIIQKNKNIFIFTRPNIIIKNNKNNNKRYFICSDKGIYKKNDNSIEAIGTVVLKDDNNAIVNSSNVYIDIKNNKFYSNDKTNGNTESISFNSKKGFIMQKKNLMLKGKSQIIIE